MKYNFDEIVNRRNTGSFKWDAGKLLMEMGFTERYDEKTLPLFTADMDFAVPPAVAEAMHRTAGQRIYGYTIPPVEYYEAIINWFRRRHDWEIKPEEIVYSPGTVNAISAAVRAFTEPGGGVIIQRPVYFPFTTVIENNGRKVANSQMLVDDEGYYVPDLTDFERKAEQPENNLFILCNPHNPSGRIFTNEDLQAMAAICKKNDIVIIADEIHGDLIRCDAVFTPMVKAASETDHIITCTAINKTFNVAGLHASNIVAPNPRLRAAYQKALGFQMPTPFTYNAVIAAYNEGEEWLEQLKQYLDVTIDWVTAFCRENLPKMKFVRPEGTYVFWMDFRGYEISAEEIRRRIYVEANVLLEGGLMYDPDRGAGFERICLASPRPVIKEAFKRIAAQFEDLN